MVRNVEKSNSLCLLFTTGRDMKLITVQSLIFVSNRIYLFFYFKTNERDIHHVIHRRAWQFDKVRIIKLAHKLKSTLKAAMHLFWQSDKI